MRGTDTSRRPRCARFGTKFANISPCRGIAHLAGRSLDIARFVIKIGMLNAQRQAVLHAQITYKGLVVIGCLPAQMMVYMQHVQSLARNGSDAAPVLNIQL